MNHKLTVSHSLSGNEFSIAIFKILSKQESIWLCLTDSFNFVLQISINYFLYIIKHKKRLKTLGNKDGYVKGGELITWQKIRNLIDRKILSGLHLSHYTSFNHFGIYQN